MSTPASRTMEVYRDMGYLCQVVEKWNPHGKVRVDLFGFIDIIAISEMQTIGIQCTTGSNMSSRLSKIQNHDNYHRVLEANWDIHLVGWRKNAKGRWVHKVVNLREESLND